MTIAARKTDRYANLDEALALLAGRGVRVLRFLEVGTYDGRRAAGLLTRWRARYAPGEVPAYYGFDLFEDMTPALSRDELSKSRLPPRRDEVRRTLLRAGADVLLFRGNTRDTLPVAATSLPAMDLIFVDGGHSLETVASDWDAVKGLLAPHAIALFDDYYLNRDDYGCRPLVDALSPGEYRVTLLDPVDRYEHTGLAIRMVSVERRGG